MKANELMTLIIGEEFLKNNAGTCDTCKAGDPEKEVKKVGTCLTATPDVIRAASAWGADLLITHEPTFYNHMDERDASALSNMKFELVSSSGMVIWRYHDSIHFRTTDHISEGFLKKMGWSDLGDFDGNMTFILHKPKTPVDIAREISEKLNIRHPRIVGKTDGQITKIGLFLGHRSHNECYQPFVDSDLQLGISGELCEWYDCEPVRDCAQFGLQKTLIILGHAASERDGMEYLAGEITAKYGLEAKYFDCGEIYTYAE